MVTGSGKETVTDVKKSWMRWIGLGLCCLMLGGCMGAAQDSRKTERNAGTDVNAAAQTEETREQTMTAEPAAERKTPDEEIPAEASAGAPDSGENPAGEPTAKSGSAESGDGTLRILVDGEAWTGTPEVPEQPEDLMVYIARGPQLLISFPFSEAHLISVIQEDGSENHILMTGELVKMMEANCGNQDCVGMGEVTRENLNERILGGFIVCLPHLLTVEVREP